MSHFQNEAKFVIKYFFPPNFLEIFQFNFVQSIGTIERQWQFFFWNTFLLITNLTHEFTSEINQQLSKIFKRKPLFKLVYGGSLQYAYPISYGINFLYFIIINLNKSNLLELLDSFQIPNLDSDSRCWKVFVAIVVLDNALLIIMGAPILRLVFDRFLTEPSIYLFCFLIGKVYNILIN